MRSASRSLVTLSLFAVLLTPSASFADDPIVKVECLCVSQGKGMAEGMTARTIDLNSDEMKAVIRNELVFILSPSEPPGEVQKRACDRLTEMVHAARTPYVPSTTPVRLELGLVTKMKPGDDYKTSLGGFTKP